MCWGPLSSHKGVQKQLETYLHSICPLRLAVSACRALLYIQLHVHICSACCRWDLSIMKRIFLTSKLSKPHFCTHKSSPNETQMWNVSAQLDLRQLRLPVDVCFQKATTFTGQSPSRHFGPGQPNAPGWFGRKTLARFRCLLWKSAPSWGDEQTATTWKNKDLQREFLKKPFLMKTF